MNHADLMHGCDCEHGADVAGWIAQEKLDGWRALWTGNALVTRQGVAYRAPAWFVEGLPVGVALDCELFAGIGQRGRLVASLKDSRPEAWSGFELVAFDAPTMPGSYSERHAALAALHLGTHARLLLYSTVAGMADALQSMRAVQARGGEGLVLREPDTEYFAGRTTQLLKLKREPVQREVMTFDFGKDFLHAV